MNRTRPYHRRAISLLELTVAMTVSSVLLGGIASSMMLASRALPSDTTANASTISAYRIADQITGEIYGAEAVTSKSTRSINFRVPTRDADANPETISYSWSGVAGAPLLRRYNGGVQQIVADGVKEFQLTYATNAVTEQPPAVDNESAEMILNSADGLPSLFTFSVRDKDWVGQCFLPTLPGSAISWRITRAFVKARQHGGTGGVTAVQIRPASASQTPDATVLEQQLMLESSLSTAYNWESFSFSSVSGLPAGQRMCLVLARQVTDAHLCDLEYGTGVLAGKVDTTNAGATWSQDTPSDLSHYIYGTITTRTTPPTVTRTYLRNVGVRIRLGSDAAAVVQTSVHVMNEPEITGL